MWNGAITAVASAVGAVAIVASAGTLAPAVIAAAGIATAGGVYGVANFEEGNEEYHYGKIGDVTTAAWNPIRDTLFFGNQKAYDFTGMACTSATAFIAPLGVCSAFISDTVTAEGIIVNTTKDMVAFSAISAGTEITGDQLGWSEPVKFGVELIAGLGFGAASIAIEKSLSNAAGKISIKEACQGGSETVNRINEIKVDFNYNSKYDETEFARQLADQEKGMNELTVQEYLDNRAKFNAQGRAIESNAAQQEARKEALANKIDELFSSGMSYEEAESEANNWIKSQAALHNPDQIAGGNPINITGMGDSKINSSIGSQWNYRIDIVDEQISKIAATMSEDELKNTYLNIRLKY